MTDDYFGDSPVSRRRFMQLSAATGAALSLPGNATADASAEAFTAEYQYVLNHTPQDHAVPTLVTFSSAAGPEAMDAALADTEVITTTEPQPAAYGKLTTSEATTVADLPEAESFQFSPGSNPFWRIGYYPLGVFPEPRRSVDLIGFEELKVGLRELETRYPDRIRVKNVGRSPGHTNNATDRPDPKGMYVAELTNFDSETDFEDKEKVFYSASLHGPEDAGRETAARILENAARGSEPDIQGSDSKIAPLLDEVVVIMGFVNPDGWVVRNPQYDSRWQFDIADIPFAPLYERGNAEVYDTNRQYPVVGMITPNHFPAQPNDAKSREEETPSFVSEKVPDAKAFVDFFSEYENLGYGADLHGGPIFNEFVLGLISQDQFDTRQMNELYEMCLNIDDTLEEALETWVTAGEVKQATLGDFRTGLLFGVLPEEAFDYSTIYDTIDYTVTGAFLDWMAHPEPIGLDLTTLDFEMSFSWAVNGQYYDPELQERKVKGYRTAIRTITDFAVRNSDTPTTDDQFGARTETGGDDVAYVVPGDDALRTTDDSLQFEAGDGDGGDGGTVKTTESVTLSEGLTEMTVDVDRAEVHSAGFHVHSNGAVADIEVVDPDGDVVASFDAVTDERAGGKCCGLPEFTVGDPQPGEWTVRVHNKEEVEREASFVYWTLAAPAPNPDPRTAWPGGEGFEQRAYDASPFQFFEDYGEFMVEGAMEAVTVDEVAGDALLEGGDPAYDHVVVIHDYGANEGADYIGDTSGYDGPADSPTPGRTVDGYTDALDSFVDAGGNLVLTDTGVNLVTELDNDLVVGDRIDREDITVPEFIVARFTDKNLDHPLFGTDEDVRPIQNQLWKVQPLGYTAGFGDGVGEAPMFLPDEDALAAAGEPATTTVAGRATNGATGEGGIAAASLTPDDDTRTGVHVISSLLPTATQQNLHPFGLQDYTVTFLGYVLFTSALGFEQVRETGTETRRYGIADDWDTSGVERLDPPEEELDVELTVEGSREVDSSVYFGRQATRVELTVDSITVEGEDADGVGEVVVRDNVPEEFDFLERFSDGFELDDTTVSFGGRDPGLEDETFVYYLETPDEATDSDGYSVGPGEGVVEVQFQGSTETESDEFAGTDTAYVVAVDV